jgi:hypothetical protein
LQSPRWWSLPLQSLRTLIVWYDTKWCWIKHFCSCLIDVSQDLVSPWKIWSHTNACAAVHMPLRVLEMSYVEPIFHDIILKHLHIHSSMIHGRQSLTLIGARIIVLTDIITASSHDTLLLQAIHYCFKHTLLLLLQLSRKYCFKPYITASSHTLALC